MDGLTTGPQVHRLPIWVLPQHFWGEVSRCPCEPCSPDTQTGRHTHRGGHISNPEQDPAGRGIRVALEMGKTSPAPQSRPRAGSPGLGSQQSLQTRVEKHTLHLSPPSFQSLCLKSPNSLSPPCGVLTQSHKLLTQPSCSHYLSRQNVPATSAQAELTPRPLPWLLGADPGVAGGLSLTLALL